jgi:hypothetical protein
MNENLKVCTVAPQQKTLSSLVASLVEIVKITRGIEKKVDDIGGKLLGLRPCDETNQPVINCLEDALRLLGRRLEVISKDVYSINERL